MAAPNPQQAVFAGVLLLANRLQARFDAVLPDLTLKQWLTLAVVASQPQPVPSTAVLVSALGTSHQNVSKLLNALAAKGFVTLEPSKADGRARQLSLTPEAGAYLERNEELGERLLGELFENTSEEDVRTCLRVLDAMGRALTSEGLVPADAQPAPRNGE